MKNTRPRGLAQRSRVALMGIIAADDLMGIEVVDRDGTPVARLHEIMLDLRRGRIAYGVLELCEARPDGERHVTVPWSALLQDGDADRFFIDAPRERIREAPPPGATASAIDVDGDVAAGVPARFGAHAWWELPQPLA